MENLVMTPDFWHSKRVLITGHTGFKGGWLALWLAKCGAKVVGYSLDPPSHPNLYESARVADILTSVKGDLNDLDLLSKTIERYSPEIVFHLAAQSLVRQSYYDPLATYKSNVMGTVHLFEAIRRSNSVRVVINVTSDKCYENVGYDRVYNENDPMGGHDPYSSSKGCSELIASAYYNSFFINNHDNRPNPTVLASVRAGNVIGGGDWAKDRLIPDIIRSFVNNRAVEIRNPNATRPWQFVLEPLGGYLLLAQKLWLNGSEYSGGWNFGPDEQDGLKVIEILESIAKLWGSGATWNIQPGDHPHEAQYLRLDCSKARSKIGWKTRWDIHDGLAATVDWYRSFADNSDTHELCLRQIEQFMSSSFYKATKR
ncbi:MAG: CDP-glucose 4,6-dehydratase [Magnetococcales bacterium]|nr:CDP-glucose 4,6-dehydratase [Magnetococcales bacterium]